MVLRQKKSLTTKIKINIYKEAVGLMAKLYIAQCHPDLDSNLEFLVPPPPPSRKQGKEKMEAWRKRASLGVGGGGTSADCKSVRFTLDR